MKLGSNDISAVKIGSTDVSKVYIGSTEVWSSFTGLLDTYTGAAAAYSLRQLSSTYTGDAIKVRRLSDDTTQDIGFVDNELDTTSLASFCSGTDGFVTTWYDQSGNGNDATQTTAANQPQIVSSGSVITENGKPSVQFDGSDDILRINYFDYYGGGISKLFTSTVATRTNSSATTRIIFSHNNEGGSPFYRSFVSAYTSGVSPGLFAAHFSTNNISNSINTFQQWSDLKQYNLITIYDTNNATTSNRVIVYANGLSTYNSTISSQSGNLSEATNIPLTIGGINSSLALWQGNIQEVVFYPSDQSSNRTSIETNINDFYSIY